MLLNKKEELQADKIRTIFLMEPDFIYINKFICKNLLARSKRHGRIAQEQSGSRTNHLAINQVVNRVLTYDILWQQKIKGVLFSIDAITCCDRIVQSVASDASYVKYCTTQEAYICVFDIVHKNTL